MPTTTSDTAADMRERFRPTPEQIAVAVAMLATADPQATGYAVAVPIALPGKQHGLWKLGQPVEAVPGFWLGHRDQETGPHAWHKATDAADRAAGGHLAGSQGSSAWAVIWPDGDWAVWEGFYGNRAVNTAPVPVIRGMLDLSIRHLPERLRDRLDSTSVVAYRMTYGWLMWLPDEPGEHSRHTEGTEDAVSGEVLAVQRYARSLGCDYVLFDGDGPVDENLPTF